MFDDISASSTDRTKVGFEISHLIEKSGRPHTVGELLVRPSIQALLEIVLKMCPEEILNKILLSNDAVSRRINAILVDMKHKLIKDLRREIFPANGRICHAQQRNIANEVQYLAKVFGMLYSLDDRRSIRCQKIRF